MLSPQYQFEWDDLPQHDVSFDVAATIFQYPHLLTVADLTHSEEEERWFSIGIALTGALLSVAYVWKEPERGAIEIRIISARRSTSTEIRYSGGRSQ